MTPDQIHRACDLLIEREEVANAIAEIDRLATVRIEGAPKPKDADTSPYFRRIGPDLPMTASIKKLLRTGPAERLAAIDKELTELGVDMTAPTTTNEDAANAA